MRFLEAIKGVLTGRSKPLRTISAAGLIPALKSETFGKKSETSRHFTHGLQTLAPCRVRCSAWLGRNDPSLGDSLILKLCLVLRILDGLVERVRVAIGVWVVTKQIARLARIEAANGQPRSCACQLPVVGMSATASNAMSLINGRPKNHRRAFNLWLSDAHGVLCGLTDKS
jgi:hypothetical protein